MTVAALVMLALAGVGLAVFAWLIWRVIWPHI